MSHITKVILLVVALTLALPTSQPQASMSAAGFVAKYTALEPLTEGNLTVFPVVTTETYDTSGFLTLDEGMQRGEVVVTEEGRAGLIRPRPRPYGPQPLLQVEPGVVPRPLPQVEPWGDGAQVNRLVLVNNSSQPLILLAGEVVTGGKQDRVVANDLIVGPHSEPMDLSVFCVEPGRWVRQGGFVSAGAPLAQPSVRRQVMVGQDQEAVWSSVGRALRAGVGGGVPELSATTSYAAGMENPEVQTKLRQLTEPIERRYSTLESELRARKAVGVVAAVNGQIIWADLFASPELFNLYWPKLVESYAAEAFTTWASQRGTSREDAQAFLDDWNGRRTSSVSEEGLYCRTEVSGDGFTAFMLTSLLPRTGFDVHDAKVAG
jgi:hypothetical protein